MSEFKKQFRGYSVQQVDSKIDDYQAELASLKQQVASLTDELDHVKEQNSLLQHRVNITEKTNEEIARLALKEASELIDKAKRNANMILKESLDYVRSLSSEMNDFKIRQLNSVHRFKKCPKIFWIQSIIRKSLILLTKKMKITKYDERDSL